MFRSSIFRKAFNSKLLLLLLLLLLFKYAILDLLAICELLMELVGQIAIKSIFASLSIGVTV